MKLATLLGSQYDWIDTVKDFTTMVKVKQLTHEGDTFDDLFLQEEIYSQVFHFASVLLAPDDLRDFHVYRVKILLNVPLDILQIEPIREPTPSESLEDNSKENSIEET